MLAGEDQPILTLLPIFSSIFPILFIFNILICGGKRFCAKSHGKKVHKYRNNDASDCSKVSKPRKKLDGLNSATFSSTCSMEELNCSATSDNCTNVDSKRTKLSPGQQRRQYLKPSPKIPLRKKPKPIMTTRKSPETIPRKLKQAEKPIHHTQQNEEITQLPKIVKKKNLEGNSSLGGAKEISQLCPSEFPSPPLINKLFHINMSMLESDTNCISDDKDVLLPKQSPEINKEIERERITVEKEQTLVGVAPKQKVQRTKEVKEQSTREVNVQTAKQVDLQTVTKAILRTAREFEMKTARDEVTQKDRTEIEK